MVSLHFCENLDKIAKSDTRGATLARAAGSLWLAGPRQLARAHRLPLVTHPAARSAGLSAGSGNAAPFPLRPGVARHQSRSRRDRGSVASFSINGTLRGADVITDHGAEYVVLAQWLPASLTPPHVVSIFSFIRTFLCFLGSPSSAAPEKKKKKKEEEKKGDFFYVGLTLG